MDFIGVATVVRMVDGQVMLTPVNGGVGGEPLRVPADAFSHPVVPGQVLRVGVLREGDDVVVDSVPQTTATRCELKRTKQGYEVKGRKGLLLPFPSALADQQSQDVAARLPYWLFASQIEGQHGHFENLQAGLADWRADRARRAAEDKETQTRKALVKWSEDREISDPESFINPYNFVPLPKAPPQRDLPPGHASRRGELLHGRIDFQMQALSPILLRDSETASGAGPAALPRRDDALCVPGSSFKGALRAAFEAVTGSCLRVADFDMVPAYRDVLRANNRAGWRLIEVVEVNQAHRPTLVRECTEPVWFSFPILESVLGSDGVRTGARLELLPGAAKNVGTGSAVRAEVRDPAKVAPAGSGLGKEYVILVTDVRARRSSMGVCFVGGALSSIPTQVSVDDQAWARFEAALDGTQDMKRGEGAGARTDEVEVEIDKLPPSRGRAFRQLHGLMVTGGDGVRRPTPGLREGHVLWARLGSDGQGGRSLLDLAFAQTWRHGASGEAASLAKRLESTNPGFQPCTGLALCPACRVFGSARTDRSSEGDPPSDDGQSPNYRGHLRFGQILVDGTTSWVDLAPMGQPRPGSGQMYLQHGSIPTEEEARAKAGQVPLREWGSALDPPGAPRPIRGRKFYWRTGTVPGRPDRHLLHRSHKGEDNSGRMMRKVELISTGAVISGHILFENLSSADLAAILVCLDPARISQHGAPGRVHRTKSAPATYCFTLGGGKPLGLGALTVKALDVTCQGAAERYNGTQTRKVDAEQIDDWVRELVAAYPDAVATWPALLELCCWNAVNPTMVGYPRDTPWPRGDGPDLYKAGFDWWKRAAGMPWDGVGGKSAELQEDFTYLVLPDATAGDVSLPIAPVGVPEPRHGEGRHGR